MSTSSKPEPEMAPFAYAEAVSGAVPARDTVGSFAPASEAVSRAQAAREQARQEGEATARAQFEAQLARERERIASALQEFTRQRENYYQKVEAEVVHLALSIARKVLHRESQVDPLLLAGIVRVALDDMQANSKVTVRVNPSNANEWRNYFSRHLDAHDLPDVIEDAGLEPGRCLLETSLGNTELGLEVQLKEIEQGLLDLLAQRPQANQ